MFSDDVSFLGDVKFQDGMTLSSDAVLQESLSLSLDLTVSDNIIYGQGVELSLGNTLAGRSDLTRDLAISNDITIVGNLSIAGTFIGLDSRYVTRTGDAMTGPLYINPSGSLALDVDGDIEYTGSLKNRSPIKISDGFEISNYGGIKGGQLFNKDVLIALYDDMYIRQIENLWQLFVPEIKYLRFSNKRPELSEISITQEVELSEGEFELPLRENEHIVSIVEITCFEAAQAFTANVGLDGVIQNPGEYRVKGQRKVSFWALALPQKAVVYVRYKVRKDIDEFNIIDFTIDKQTFEIPPKGWHVICVEEEPLEDISSHDTAAMSPTTKVELSIMPISEYIYSADTIVIGIVTDEGNVNQYY